MSFVAEGSNLIPTVYLQHGNPLDYQASFAATVQCGIPWLHQHCEGDFYFAPISDHERYSLQVLLRVCSSPRCDAKLHFFLPFQYCRRANHFLGGPVAKLCLQYKCIDHSGTVASYVRLEVHTWCEIGQYFSSRIAQYKRRYFSFYMDTILVDRQVLVTRFLLDCTYCYRCN